VDDESAHDPRAGTASAVTPPHADTVIDRLQRICHEAVRALSASGVGVSVMAENGVHGMAAASDPATARIEELQFTFGEGPCVDAFATSRPVLVSDLADGAMGRWPIYAPAVHDAGIRAVFAFPMQVGAARLGVLDVLRAFPGPLSRRELGEALTFADRAVTALLDGQEQAATALDGLNGLEEAIEHRAAVFQAQGMVMVQLGVPIAEALVRIRAYAYAENRPLNDVAADIVARRLRFDGEC
jgi:hypothetical protein